MKIIFCGTPEFSVPSLERLAKEHEIVAVVSQPDKPTGRKLVLQSPPVAGCAKRLGLNLLQPKLINRISRELRELKPDVLVVVAYGQLLKAEVLNIAIPINAHASLLPLHRGASPIQAAILAGDDATGVSIMKMEAGLDTGPVILRWSCPILPIYNAQMLHDRLAEISASALSDVLSNRNIFLNSMWMEQGEKSTYCSKINKEDGVIDFKHSAIEICRRVRAMTPWPGAWATMTNGKDTKRIKLAYASLIPSADSLPIETGNGTLYIKRVQPEGKPEMSIKAFMNGAGRGFSF